LPAGISISSQRRSLKSASAKSIDFRSSDHGHRMRITNRSPVTVAPLVIDDGAPRATATGAIPSGTPRAGGVRSDRAAD
jgi:hypothetical protein